MSLYPVFCRAVGPGHGLVDLIGLPVGIPLHADMVIQALQAGYHVHVEKPLAVTVQQVRAIQQAERDAGRWVAVGYQFIYSPTIQWLRDKLRSGALGRLRTAISTVGWPRSASYYQRNAWAGALRLGAAWALDGPATNATAHYLNNLLYLAGSGEGGRSIIASVRAELYRAKPIPSYDTAAIEILTTESSRLIHLTTHATDETQEPVMELDCEGGQVHWEARPDSAVITYADGRQERFANPAPHEVHNLPFQQVARVVAGAEPRPLCGTAESADQVLAINLAFESGGGIHVVPEAHRQALTAEDGSELVVIPGMAQALRRAHAERALFADLALPWARPGTLVAASDYVSFPSAQLARSLSPQHA